MDPTVLEEVDPEAAEKLRRDIEYWGGVPGFSWAVQEQFTGRYPKQIVGWKRDGFVLPYLNDEDINEWMDDRNTIDWTVEQEAWPRDAIDCISQAVQLAEDDHETGQKRGIALFDGDPSLWPFSDSHAIDLEVINGWRPLFTFQGPLDGDVQDEHIVIFRKAGRKFEHLAGCTRWNW